LVNRCSQPGDVILDPFCGGGTTGVVALDLGRFFIGADIDPKMIAVSASRFSETSADAA
jgi:site-specific DNA-methyltransferase (adenine-specific)